jgi:hypothetical protein
LEDYKSPLDDATKLGFEPTIPAIVTTGGITTRNHPDRGLLQRFLRGEASREEKGEVVRHLLAGCRECVAVTRPVWGMAGSLEEDLVVLAAQAVRPRPNHEICCISRAWRDEG